MRNFTEHSRLSVKDHLTDKKKEKKKEKEYHFATI